MLKKVKGVLVGAVAVALPVVSNAAIDVSAATTSITTDGTAAITAIGGALIGLAAVGLVFRWVKGSLF